MLDFMCCVTPVVAQNLRCAEGLFNLFKQHGFVMERDVNNAATFSPNQDVFAPCRCFVWLVK
ncbi:Uncharacterised protein [Yersinia enterocolitica]|nr:hypothetical protein CH47_3987 [Yersinia enterocolitica]VTP83926.1 Uncharacterised protein [Yersinia enterocolitica subsp. enterocolitica]AJJ23990.1 hypothetical protein CH49_3260 [Yersinia enterocolitica]CFB67785.1 Uncharacterised protein [Yersinia enterocolitica]CFQ17350.1 Uncharacterised protein [Yersinia enterocolitica]